MKHIINEGKISELFSDKGNAGWSREVNLIEHHGKKYVLRRAQNIQRAQFYEQVSKKLEKYGILPKFLGRYGSDVIFEYIEGRDLTKKESPAIIKQLGAISAIVNAKRKRGSISARFDRQLKECISGNFKDINKKFKPILSKEKSIEIREVYNRLKRETKPILAWDVNDMTNENFRLRKGKVYLVDIDSIETRVRGLGIGKAFTKWFRLPEERKAFLSGYNSVASTAFLTEDYLDFIFLNFIVQDLNYALKYKDKHKSRAKMRKKELETLLKKHHN